MKPTPIDFPDFSDVDQAAAKWVWRSERGLSPIEQDQLSEWLAASPRHRKAFAESHWSWDELDRLAGLQSSEHAQADPNLLEPGKQFGPNFLQRHWKKYLTLVPLAAAIALSAYYLDLPRHTVKDTPVQETHFQSFPRLDSLALEDGSKVELNRGAIVETDFSSETRRVRLLKGEANFIVAKDLDRPFIVEVGGVAVRAVGTVFNIRYDDETVDVIVSEGKVMVLPESEPELESKLPLLETGHRALISINSPKPAIEVSLLDKIELEEQLRWQPRLLDFDAASLNQIVAAFNRSNPVKLVIKDPALESIELSCSLRSDNIRGFVRLMESSFGMKATWEEPSVIFLTEAK